MIFQNNIHYLTWQKACLFVSLARQNNIEISGDLGCTDCFGMLFTNAGQHKWPCIGTGGCRSLVVQHILNALLQLFIFMQYGINIRTIEKNYI